MNKEQLNRFKGLFKEATDYVFFECDLVKDEDRYSPLEIKLVDTLGEVIKVMGELSDSME